MYSELSTLRKTPVLLNAQQLNTLLLIECSHDIITWEKNASLFLQQNKLFQKEIIFQKRNSRERETWDIKIHLNNANNQKETSMSLSSKLGRRNRSLQFCLGTDFAEKLYLLCVDLDLGPQKPVY